MPRLMSVSKTEQAVIDRTKTVTRRSGWSMLRPGDRLTLCRKVMGRRKGEPLVRLCDVEVVSVRREVLSAITDDDVAREGFTRSSHPVWWSGWQGWTPAQRFVEFFCEEMGGGPDQEVTRVEWRYLDTQPAPTPLF